MTQKELHRLGRKDLLQLLLTQGEETAQLNEQLKKTEEELEALRANYEKLRKRLDHKDEQIHRLQDTLEEQRKKRRIELEEAGSIAEAALRLNGIFEAAQRAADQYLYNLTTPAESTGPELPEDETEELPSPEETLSGGQKETETEDGSPAEVPAKPEGPGTEASEAEEPQQEAPAKPEGPGTEASEAEEPQQEAPAKPEEPGMEASEAEEPQQEAPTKPEEPGMEASEAEELLREIPTKPEESEMEASEAEEPQQEASQPEEPIREESETVVSQKPSSKRKRTFWQRMGFGRRKAAGK